MNNFANDRAPRRICVVGLGYIGLPTAVLFASNGCLVHGADVNDELVAAINSGRIPFFEPDLAVALEEAQFSGHFCSATTPAAADAFVITVPTPLTGDKKADLSHVWSAAKSIAPLLTGMELVILESTCPPGTTNTFAKALINARPDLTLTPNQPNSLYIAHCPERVIPGKIMVEMVENDRIIGGINSESSQRAVELYDMFSLGEFFVTDSATAELVKLAENSFRDVNIAFANELSLICHKLELDEWEVIELANRHPRVNILKPGPGVGGHCIAVDPWFVHEAAPQESRLIKAARLVNDSKPHHVIDRVVDLASKNPEAVILALGLTFKADIDDLRESPALEIVKALSDQLSEHSLLVSDPNVPVLPASLKNRRNVTPIDAESGVDKADIVLLLVDHAEFRCIARSQLEGKVIIDTKGFLRKLN